LTVTPEMFAATYNNVRAFPTLDLVSHELGITRKRVVNRAAEMRRSAEFNPDVPVLQVRIESRGHVAPATETSEPTFGNVEPLKVKKMSVRRNGVRYFILSSAQDETAPHEGFLANLKAYAAWLGDCEIRIAGFTYNKSVFEEGRSRASGKKTNPIHFHESLKPFLSNDQVEIGKNILFCGEMNTLPTATHPLSGFEVYTRDKWGIFPHAKIQMMSIPTMKSSRSKILMTTGAVTMPNYVQKKAGIKASFHHQLGAILVELASDGTFFCRHLHSDGLGVDQGGFYDLDRRVVEGSVTEGHRVEAINYGDIHHEKLDPEVALSTWGYDVETGNVISKNTLVESLRPAHAFYHDLSDFTPRNHHNVADAHFLFKTHKDGTNNVESALEGCARFLDKTKRRDTVSVVIQSNHDNALLRWLKYSDYREDPENALFFLHTQASYYRQMSEGVEDPKIFQQVLQNFTMDSLADVIFVNEDDSYLVAGNIECGMHGHLGANGSRGGAQQFSKFGRKSNTGHSHSATIIDGAYVAGVSGKLCMGYNKGPSSWSHSHIVTYQNGARTIVTMMNGRWFHGHRSQGLTNESSGASKRSKQDSRKGLNDFLNR
jgi:hypothetical protein